MPFKPGFVCEPCFFQHAGRCMVVRIARDLYPNALRESKRCVAKGQERFCHQAGTPLQNVPEVDGMWKNAGFKHACGNALVFGQAQDMRPALAADPALQAIQNERFAFTDRQSRLTAQDRRDGAPDWCGRELQNFSIDDDTQSLA